MRLRPRRKVRKTLLNNKMKKKHRFYKKEYGIKNVISHKPNNPKHAYQLSFMVEWENPKDVTIEMWKKNSSLHCNNTVLLYMLNNKDLIRFVPDSIIIKNTHFIRSPRKIIKVPIEENEENDSMVVTDDSLNNQLLTII